MPRVPRRLVVIPNHPHHVILRGNNRRRLFSYPREYRFFLRRVVQGSKERLVPVHTTMLMTNHVHLIVTPRGPQELSSFVRSFAQTYSQFRNRSRASSGKLFEERYKCVPIVSEEQMAITTAYIELNPVRAGISVDPGQYRWSTFAQHVGGATREPLLAELWEPSAWYMSLGSDPAQRAAAYCEWFEHYRARDEWSQVYGDPKRNTDRKRFERPNRKKAL